MKKKISKWFRAHKIETAVAIIFAAIGFLVGLATRYDLDLHLQFDDKIDPVALLSLACTVVLAWIVTTILEKQKEVEKSAKEILLKRVEDLHICVTQASSNAVSGNFRYTDAAAFTKKTETTVTRLWQLVAGAGIECDLKVKDSITELVNQLDILLTDLPIDVEGAAVPLKVENGILSFSSTRTVEIETAFDELLDRITNFEFAIISG